VVDLGGQPHTPDRHQQADQDQRRRALELAAAAAADGVKGRRARGDPAGRGQGLEA
jgi:hypothetical protein